MAPEFRLVPVRELHPHEEVEPGRADALAKVLARQGRVDQPIVVDRATLVILDGHHRYEAVRALGLRLVPAYLVDYQDPRITVRSWRANRMPPSRAEVVAQALAGRRYPPKTTRHVFPEEL
ncbi:MAG: ParB N-terminal domain-containing protein, partial [Methanobacteriota archaeon]